MEQFILIFILLKFSEVPAPPPPFFKFLRTLLLPTPAVVRSSPEVVRSQVFTRLEVLKETLQSTSIVDGKVKAINNACRTAE